MKPDELLIPRFIVTKPYPGCPFEVGEILHRLTPNGNVWGFFEPRKHVENPENFPHIFRSLDWWEHREEKDMP